MTHRNTRGKLIIAGAIAAFILSILFNGIVQILIERFTAKNGTSTVNMQLFDLGFYIIPFINNSILYTFVSVAPKAFFVVVLIVFIFLRQTRMVFLLFLLLSICFILRGMSIIATVLPPPNNNCVYIPEDHGFKVGDFIYEIFALLFGIKETCRDFFFSGHMATFGCTLILILFRDDILMKVPFQLNYPSNTRYSFLQAEDDGNTNSNIKVETSLMYTFLSRLVLYFGLCFVYAVLLLLVRFHYTIDIFCGMILPVQIYVILFIFKQNARYIQFLEYVNKHIDV